MRIFSRSILCGLAVLFLVTSFSAGDDVSKNQFKPDNAAYWYCKAYELYKQADEVELKDFVRGRAKLTDEIRDFVEKQQPVIEMVTKAAKMEKCDWGYDPTANIWLPDWPYWRHTFALPYLLFVDAKIKEEGYKYSEALDTCETIFRFAHHIEDKEGTSFLHAAVTRGFCFKYFSDFMNNNPDTDVQYLQRINKMIKSRYAFFRYKQSDILEFQLKCAETALSKSHNYGLIDLLQQEDGTKNSIDFTHKYGVDKLNNDSLKLYRKYTRELLALLKTPDMTNQDMIDACEPYDEKSEKAFNFMFSHDEGDPPTQKMYDEFLSHSSYVFIFIHRVMNPPARYHYFQILQQTEFNALRTAVPILIEYRKTGKLADKLPTDKYPGMFSKKPFKYIKAADKFTLECTGYDTRKKKFHSFEFKLAVKEQK